MIGIGLIDSGRLGAGAEKPNEVGKEISSFRLCLAVDARFPAEAALMVLLSSSPTCGARATLR